MNADVPAKPFIQQIAAGENIGEAVAVPGSLAGGTPMDAVLPGGVPINGALTRAHLAEAVYVQVGLSRNESADLLEMVLGSIATALEAGDSVKISGFGTFSVRQKSPRVGRNPKTGIEAIIHARRVLIFRPSQVLKAHVNGTTIPLGDDE